jgi:hypothetical protein
VIVIMIQYRTVVGGVSFVNHVNALLHSLPVQVNFYHGVAS